MSESSPSDLATAFRSIPRRVREARGELADADIADLVTAIDGHLDAAARDLLCASEAAAIADAIEAVPPARWDDTTLDDLRSRALELGRLVRTLEERAAE